MRRVLLGLAVTALTVLALAGPASAASGQVLRYGFHGTFAQAVWFTSTPTSDTLYLFIVQHTNKGPVLGVEEKTDTYDANGLLTGESDIRASVTSGFTSAIDQAHLTTASVSASGVPATACTYDDVGNTIGCSATTVDLSASWTGQGPISRGIQNQHFKEDGFSLTIHFNGTDREATATGTFNGVTLGAADLGQADIGFTNTGTTQICSGATFC